MKKKWIIVKSPAASRGENIYIFGNNITQKKIAMTAPVQQQSTTKIAMTAPVQQQKEGDAWTVSFVMPSKYTLKSLPKPKNNRIHLKAMPERQFIVVQFSGMHSNSNIAKYKKQLMQYIQKIKLQTVGTPIYAFYNPPWTLPFMRRNEIMLELKLNS